ncbi:MAG TPA: NAD-dependent deacylase [Roseiflexaceae bacterium]|nr:NAD-dependent deacylase [Roseiflexaceae bacterium]
MQPDAPLDIPAELIDTLRAARHIAVLTGAGISAESGLPTFRDRITGLWTRFSPEELSTPEGFRNDPARVWTWHSEMREMARQAEPNPAHLALVEMERHAPVFTLLTQNIDSLHQRAGSSRVVELHGNIFRARCNSDGLPVEGWEDSPDIPPRCPRCGGLVRPALVWFRERLPDAELAIAEAAVADCDVFFAIGTSGEVEPAASFAPRAVARGATVVVINLDVVTSAVPQLYRFRAPAGVLLPQLVAATWGV